MFEEIIEFDKESILETEPIQIREEQFAAILKYYKKKRHSNELSLDFFKDQALIEFLVRFKIPYVKHIRLNIPEVNNRVKHCIKRTIGGFEHLIVNKPTVESLDLIF